MPLDLKVSVDGQSFCKRILCARYNSHSSYSFYQYMFMISCFINHHLYFAVASWISLTAVLILSTEFVTRREKKTETELKNALVSTMLKFVKDSKGV